MLSSNIIHLSLKQCPAVSQDGFDRVATSGEEFELKGQNLNFVYYT